MTVFCPFLQKQNTFKVLIHKISKLWQNFESLSKCNCCAWRVFNEERQHQMFKCFIKSNCSVEKVWNDECECLKSANLKWGILLPSDHIYGKNWPSTSIKEFVLRAFTSAASLLIILISSFNAGLKLKATENIRDTEQRAWLKGIMIKDKIK